MSGSGASATGTAFRLVGCRRGDAVVEFALVLPVLLLLFAGIVEVGRLITHAAVLEKALRSGGLYAAFSEQPLSAADIQRAINLVRTGTADGSGDALLPGLADERSKVTVTLRSYDLNGAPVSVVHMSARMPYEPLLGKLTGPIGLDDFMLDFDHEQPYVGD